MTEENKIDFKLENNVVCICARRGSGKSELLKYLVSIEPRKFHKIWVICPTANGFYNTFIDDKCIFSEYSSDLVQQIYDKCTKININTHTLASC